MRHTVIIEIFSGHFRFWDNINGELQYIYESNIPLETYSFLCAIHNKVYTPLQRGYFSCTANITISDTAMQPSHLCCTADPPDIDMLNCRYKYVSVCVPHCYSMCALKMYTLCIFER